MAKTRAEDDSGDEVARLLALQVRLSSGNQTRAIVELSKAGIRPSRIADLLGTSPGTVTVALQRSKKSKDGTDG